ncbi:trypsin-like serine peptidase [Geomesophilobacter sediminis]|uniref:Trypsin-like peptidase domain-containing protein n=1 Tax=Geomesophilobacter sediminis TaxID=2798584 RepID=A0A8J7J9R7_9BACT|nr:serine protease [Geomesophilobacter sediminis]MBJ6723441.1 trypsin-like peptidase domain-containing protein [Geomesophilobacter sediminis]
MKSLFYLAVLVFLSLFTLSGCGSSGGSASSADLPNFNDITSAPAAIQQAAKAVVRVQVAGGAASGSFISSTGLMLTNNHVLGNEVCPTEGCYVELTFDWQAGSPYSSPRIYYAVPKAVDAGLDMAVVQIYQYRNGPMIQTPNYLSLETQTPASLLKTHVTIVGHPEGYLKKWTDGTVVDIDGDWIRSSTYILPGDSGSPILNDAGHIVGLVHRGSASEDVFTLTGASVYSVGTASAPLIAALNAPLPSTMLSVSAPTTTQKFLDNDLVYLNAHVTTVTVDGTSQSPLTVLAQACDSALARNDFLSPEDLSAALQPCHHAQAWIDCRSDIGQGQAGVMCPPASETAAWVNRFNKMNQAQIAMNGAMDLYSVSGAIAQLQSTKAQGYTAGAQALAQAVSQTKPVLDFQVASYLAEFNIMGYGGQSVADYVANYSGDPVYAIEGVYVADAELWLNSKGAVSAQGLASFLSRLHDDPNSTVGTKLFIENYQHAMGVR